MNGTELHQRVLDAIEDALARRGHSTTPARREQMAHLLHRIDGAQASQELDALCADLERETQAMSDETAQAVRDPIIWPHEVSVGCVVTSSSPSAVDRV